MSNCTNYCEQCDQELTTEHSFLNTTYAEIVGWLCDRTCIPWYQMARGGNEDCNMWGTVYVYEVEDIGDKSDKTICYTRGEGEDTEYKVCTEVSNTSKLHIEIAVYEKGLKTKNCPEGTYEYVEKLSPSDIIQQIDDHFYVEGIKDVGITRIKNIKNGYEHKKGSWRRSSTAEFAVKVCRKVSYHNNNDCLVVCVEDCSGNPLCVPPKQCEE